MKRLVNSTFIFVVLLLALAVSTFLYGAEVPTPFLEWAAVILYSNYFIIISFNTPFYESIHDEGRLLLLAKDQNNNTKANGDVKLSSETML